jgi:hypothetical protein
MWGVVGLESGPKHLTGSFRFRRLVFARRSCGHFQARRKLVPPVAQSSPGITLGFHRGLSLDGGCGLPAGRRFYGVVTPPLRYPAASALRLPPLGCSIFGLNGWSRTAPGFSVFSLTILWAAFGVGVSGLGLACLARPKNKVIVSQLTQKSIGPEK